MFQVNYGHGYGRYVNDLETIGGQDAVFNPVTGEMDVLPVFSSFLAFQKWWGWKEGLRSTFVVSWVNIDNLYYQLPSSYHSTQRVSGNLIWSPVLRVDIGGELIWGRREDKDNADGTAGQLQIMAKYRF